MSFFLRAKLTYENGINTVSLTFLQHSKNQWGYQIHSNRYTIFNIILL